MLLPNQTDAARKRAIERRPPAFHPTWIEPTWIERSLSGIVCTVAISSLAATALVLLGGKPTVFNQNIALVNLLNKASFGALVPISAALAVHAAIGWIPRIAKVLRLVFLWVLMIEAGLWATDRLLVSVKTSLLPNAFRNETLADGEPLILFAPTPLSPFGFRTARAEPQKVPGFRILFLGDSYVFGSGYSFEYNYPQVVERELRKRLPEKNVTVMSAGVNGAGVHDYLQVYRYLLERGYDFDAVVVNIFLQNDPTDDVPGTRRLAIAGQPARLYDDLFLRYFYPLNSYVFRYALYFYVLSHSPWIPRSVESEERTASCTPSAGFASFIRERAIYYYGEGGKNRIFLNYLIEDAKRIAGLAAAKGSQFYTILLPDPTAALNRLRSYAGGEPLAWDWTRDELRLRLDGSPQLDLTSFFRNREELYRCDDNHWSNAGNLVAGAAVAAWLGDQLSDAN
jgi:hypothetical protein